MSITRVENDSLTDESAAALAAEIARLDVLLAALPDSKKALLAEAARGPLERYFREGDGERKGEIALLRARARMAAHDALVARRPKATPPSPPWLKSALTAVMAPALLAVLVAIVTSFMQLKLYRDQTAQDAMRKQADLLLGQLASIVETAVQLRNKVAFSEKDGRADQGEIDAILKPQATQLQAAFAGSVRLHAFTGFPELQKAQLGAYYEISALLDCLDQSAGRQAASGWRKAEPDQSVLKEAMTDFPCSTNFDVNALEQFKDAVKQNVDQRIGGALFPSKLPVR